MKKIGKDRQAVPNSVLRGQRTLHYWTQSQVAEQVGTTTANVYRWESGLTTPSLYFRQKLCDFFSKSAAELDLLSESERQEQGDLSGEEQHGSGGQQRRCAKQSGPHFHQSCVRVTIAR